MKMILHHLRKELTVTRFLVLIVLALQFLRLAVLLGWTGSPAGDLDAVGVAPSILEAMVVFGSPGLVSPLIILVLLVDSPFRRDGFLATRPVRGREVMVAKVLTVLLAVVVPVLLVEWIHLAAVGMSAGEIIVGLVQAGLALGAIMLGLTAFVWLWRTKREGAVAGSCSVLLLIGAILLGGLLTHLQWRHLPGGRVGHVFEEVFTVPRILAGGWLLVAAWWSVLALFGKSGRTGFGLRFGLVGASLAAVVLGIWFWPRKAVEAVDGGQLGYALGWTQVGEDRDGGKLHTLVLEPGLETMPELHTEAWEFAGLRMNGRELRVPKRPNPRRLALRWVPWGRSRSLSTSGMREVLANDPVVLAGQVGRASVAKVQMFLSEGDLKAGDDEVEATLHRHRFRWQQVAEFPLEKGARSGDWELEDWDSLSLWQNRDVSGRIRLSLSVRERNLWLIDSVQRIEPWITKVLLVDDSEGICIPAEHVRGKTTLGRLTGSPWSGLRVEFEGRGLEGLEGDLEGCRVLVFEAQWESSVGFEWSGRVGGKELSQGGSLARDARDGTLEELDRWLAENPVPAAASGERDVARHVVSILERANRLPKRLPDGHEAERRLVAMVPEHLSMLIRAHGELAADQHTSRYLLQRAIAGGIDEKALAEHLPALVKMSEVREAARENGWFDGLEAELVAGARAGNGTMFMETVRLPDRGGLSIDECLYLFRRSPDSWSYRTLKDVEELRPLIDGEIDAWLEATLRRASPFSGSIDPALKLALRRGHPEGPAVLQKVLRKAITDETRASSYQSIWHQHFVRTEEGNHPFQWAEWFLKLDADRFTFDEKEGKYRLEDDQPGQSQ